MNKWTWTEQPLNDRDLRPPTFMEVYKGEVIYSSFIITVLIVGTVIVRKIFKKEVI